MIPAEAIVHVAYLWNQLERRWGAFDVTDWRAFVPAQFVDGAGYRLVHDQQWYVCYRQDQQLHAVPVQPTDDAGAVLQMLKRMVA